LERDAAIAAKNSTTTAGSPTKIGEDPDIQGFKKGGLKVQTAEAESPTKTRDRPPAGGDDGGFIKRSDKKREETKVEEPDSSSRRQNRGGRGFGGDRPADDDASGFVRRDVKAKRTTDDSGKKEAGTPGLTRGTGTAKKPETSDKQPDSSRGGGDKKPESGGGSGFGNFRSNAGAKKGARGGKK